MKRGRKGKYKFAEYREARKTTVQKLTNERSLERSTLKRDSIGAHVEERTRRIISYGPPAFQIDDMVKILKDTAPGTHPRFSYDKLGVIKKV